MVKCLICGVEKKCSIVEHLKFEHKMKSADYKLMFIGCQVNSNSELKKISERFKKILLKLHQLPHCCSAGSSRGRT